MMKALANQLSNTIVPLAYDVIIHREKGRIKSLPSFFKSFLNGRFNYVSRS